MDHIRRRHHPQRRPRHHRGRTAPDALWVARNDHSDAEGAGISTVYPKPSWQDGIPALAGITGRAEPDIAMDADDGTSQASPFGAFGVLPGREDGAVTENAPAEFRR